VVDTIREVVDAVRDPTSWRRSETMTTRAEEIRESTGKSSLTISRSAVGVWGYVSAAQLEVSNQHHKKL